MIGRRVYPGDDGELRLAGGDYGFNPVVGIWYCCPPDYDYMVGNLKNHTVTEHPDGTITVSPSILLRRRDHEEWHGFLEAGVWRTA